MTAGDAQVEVEGDPKDDVELAPGDMLGAYTIVRFLARGGMGKVWIARLAGTRGFSKCYALKTMLPSFAAGAEYVKIFLDEANVAAALHHPNVCQVFDFGTERDVLYIAMEWVEGASLSALLHAEPDVRLPLPVAVRIVADAAAGLMAVHDASDLDGRRLDVIHRDVTPQNILISTAGHVKLADFGVARFSQQAHNRTRTGIVKGKAHYIAPEQILGSSIDQRSDIFGLGCVLYEATVGRRPFDGRDIPTVMRAVIKGQLRPPRAHVPDYPPGLEAIVLRALAKAPGDRFESARAFRIAIEEWLSREGQSIGQSDIAAELKARLGSSIDRLREELRLSTRELQPSVSDRMTSSGRILGAPEEVPLLDGAVSPAHSGTSLAQDVLATPGAPSPEGELQSGEVLRPAPVPPPPVRWVHWITAAVAAGIVTLLYALFR